MGSALERRAHRAPRLHPEALLIPSRLRTSSAASSPPWRPPQLCWTCRRRPGGWSTRFTVGNGCHAHAHLAPSVAVAQRRRCRRLLAAAAAACRTLIPPRRPAFAASLPWFRSHCSSACALLSSRVPAAAPRRRGSPVPRHSAGRHAGHSHLPAGAGEGGNAARQACRQR